MDAHPDEDVRPRDTVPGGAAVAAGVRAADPDRRGMSRGLILLFSVATGQAVASNYLGQPLLDTVRGEFGVTAGLVAEVAGWRTVYWLAAALMVVQAIVLFVKLPRRREPVQLSYPKLLGSVIGIARAEPVLRRRALYGSLSFAAFSVLWTTLAFLLAGPRYGYGDGTIGLFGLVGAAGALTATVVGRFTDRGWARGLTGLSAGLLLAGFALLWLGGTSLAAVYERWGWNGACTLGAVVAIAAAARWMTDRDRPLAEKATPCEAPPPV